MNLISIIKNCFLSSGAFYEIREGSYTRFVTADEWFKQHKHSSLENPNHLVQVHSLKKMKGQINEQQKL